MYVFMYNATLRLNKYSILTQIFNKIVANKKSQPIKIDFQFLNYELFIYASCASNCSNKLAC